MLRSLLGLALILCWADPALAQFPRRPPTSEPVNLRLRVMLADETTAPRNLQVQVMNTSGSTVVQGFTDSSGQAEFRVFPGTYRIQVQGNDIETTVTGEFHIHTHARDHAEIVRVEARQQRERAAASSMGLVAVTEMDVPSAARKEFERGQREAERKRWKEAATHFQKAVEAHPRYSSAYNNLGASLLASGQEEPARDAFERALELNPQFGDALKNLGRLEYRTRSFDKAKPLLARVAALDPRDAEALVLLATAQLLTGELFEAAQTARRVHLMEHAGYALAHMVAARALEGAGQLAEAEREYQMFLQEDPHSAMAAKAQAALEGIRARQVQQAVQPPR